MQSLKPGCSDWAMLPDPDLKSIRQYIKNDEPSVVYWVLLIAGQFNGSILFAGVGNADDVLADVDVDVVDGFVEAVEVDEADEVVIAALVTAASAGLLALGVVLALLALLALLLLFLLRRAPVVPPTTAAMTTSATIAATMRAVRFERPHQGRGLLAGSGCASWCSPWCHPGFSGLPYPVDCQ